MYHLNMIKSFPLLFGLVFGIINVVVGEIDLLADPGVINLDDGLLTLEYVISDIDLLKETEYDFLQEDDLISTIEYADDEVDSGDVTVDGVGSDGDIIISSPGLSLPGVDISAVDGEAPAGAVEEAEATTTTEKNVQTTRTTDPRLERFAERLELITLPPDARKRRKIELQLQKISVQNTEEQERKRQERKQKRLEKREKKKLERLEKRKEKVDKSGKKKDQKSKTQERKKDNKKNAVINLLEEINDSENSVENNNIIEENNSVPKKSKQFKISKDKRSKKENRNIFEEQNLIAKKAKKLRKSDEKSKKKEEKKLENVKKRKAKVLTKGKEHKKENRNIFEEKNLVAKKAKNLRKLEEKSKQKEEKKLENVEKRKAKFLRKSEEKRKKKEEKNLENVEKRKAKVLRKGKERNLRILQRMIENEERRVPLMIESKDRNLQSRKIERNRVDYRRKKHNLKVWKSMKEKLIKKKKEIRFLLRLKRGFGARLDNDHKREVAQKLMKLKRKYSNGKDKFQKFQKNNWELIEESKLYSNLNRLKKKISYLKKKKKQHANVPNSKYVLKLSKRINYFQNKYEETKKKHVVVGKFNTKFENRKIKYKKLNPRGYYLKSKKINSKIKTLKKIEIQIVNEPDSEYKLKLNEKIKVLVRKYWKYRRLEKSINETKKEKKTRQLKEKIKVLEKKRKRGVDLVTETKLVKRRDDLIERYKKMRIIIKYERRNKCYLREDRESKNVLKMQNIKEAIESLKDKRKHINSKVDPEHRTKTTNIIKRLVKSYKKYKRLEIIKNETKTERKNRKLRDEILSLMKIKKERKDQNAKIDLYKKIKKLLERYKKTRKIMKYENKYECRYFRKSTKIREKIKLLGVKRRHIDGNADSKVKIRLTKKIRHLIKVFEKYRKSERERNESENERKLRVLKEEIKTIVKVQRSSNDLSTKTKLLTQVKKLKKKYKSIFLKVKYETRNKDQIRKSYERRTITKYYTRMENLKVKIKLLIKRKRQIGKEIDPRYKIKLNEGIKKLIDMYKKYKRMEKIKTETKKEKKSRNLKEKIRYLKIKMNKSTDSRSKEKISNVIYDLTERYKKIHNIIKYEKKNQCYLREDYTSIKYLKMEKLQEEIKLLIHERRIIGSEGDPKQKLNLKRKIKDFIKKYKIYRNQLKLSNETKNESKNRILKEKIKYLMKMKRTTEDQNVKANLSKRIKRLVKRYRKMRKIIKYENAYECRYFNRVQKLKDKAKELIKTRRQISSDNEAQQKVILSKRIANLKRKYKKYNNMEKIRKETENGRKMRKLKDELKSLLVLRKEATDMNEKTELSKKISTSKNIYKNIRLIVKYEEKDMEQISRSYESQIKSKHYVKMQKLKPKIRSLKIEKRQLSNKEDSESILELRKRVKSLIRKYENHKRSIRKNYYRKNRKLIKNENTSPTNKHLERRKINIQQRQKHKSQKNMYKREDIAKRKRQQRKLRLRRRGEKRERMNRRGHQKAARKINKSNQEREGRGDSDPILPEDSVKECISDNEPSSSDGLLFFLILLGNQVIRLLTTHSESFSV